MADAGGVTLNKIQIGAFAPCPLLSNVDGNYTPLLDILDTMQTSIDECCEADIADAQYYGDPLLEGSWKIEKEGTTETELYFMRESAAGAIGENWVRKGNFPREYGELYRAEASYSVGITEQNVWYNSLNLLEGACYGVVYVEGAEDDNHLKIPTGHGGIYRITWAASLAGATGKTYELAVSVNGTVSLKSISQRVMGSGDVGTMAGTAILELPDEAEVRFVTRCITAAVGDATYVYSNLNIARI